MTRIDRRRFVLCSSAFATLALLPRALAQPARLGGIPEVDSLTVRVVTDSSYDTPIVGTSKWVKTRRAGLQSPTDFRKTLHNEWGLALALESRIGTEARHILLDFGYTPAALLNNLEYMGIDGGRMHALIASHGHFDHLGGLVGFLEKYRGALPPDLVIYVGGEDVFCRRVRAGAGGHLTDSGYFDRRELERLKVRVVTCEKPTVVAGHAFTTGWIPRASFEKVQPPLPMVEYVPRDGVGCSIPAENEKAQGKPVFDQHVHEHGTCFNVKGRGLVVISSCGHAGIVNTARAAIEASGVRKVHAVMGGFHLFGSPGDYVRKTVDELNVLGTEVFIPMHCSGPSLAALLKSEMADRVITSTPGTEFTFGA